ncbi:hypothetical protein BJY52DRAFT_1212387 [Lactarius psammicola]|nr:hypothetical protein BJY52DRAFT_1212387 [Lactarius psammicola]
MDLYDPDHDTEHQPTNNAQAERGIHRDSSGKIWSIYLAEADKQDEDITSFWRGEAESILVFTGLFSGVVSTFLSISISDLRTGTNSDGIVYSPTLYSVVINVLWLLSMVFSLSSALFATLFQQWSRRYLELTQLRVAPHKRARIRGYMFSGISAFKMSLAVKLMPMLLHLSIFLFLRWSRCLYLENPRRGRLLCSWLCFGHHLRLCFSDGIAVHIPQFSLQHPILRIRGLSLSLLSRGKPNYQRPEELQVSRWSRWEKVIKMRIETHKKWLKDGLQKSIMYGATDAPPDVDKGALTWTLTVLDDDREFEDFVARVPGFMDSNFISHPPSIILPLMNDQPDQQDQQDQFDPVLGSRINDLLKTCVPGTSPLTEQLRRNRLRVCMRTLWYCAREYNKSCDTYPLPSYVRTTFANPEMTRRIQSEEDLAARLIGRSFGSLVVKKLVRDIDTRTAQGYHYDVAWQSCLAAILGKTCAEVVTLLSQPGAISLANIVSLTSSEMDTVVEEGVPSEVLDIFRTTLDILAEDLLASPNADPRPDLVTIFHATYSNAQRLQAPDWLMDRLRQISEKLSVISDEPEVIMWAMPQPESSRGL